MTQLPRTPSFSLEGRHALVTGGSSGIGLGCAVALAEAGDKLKYEVYTAKDHDSKNYDERSRPRSAVGIACSATM